MSSSTKIEWTDQVWNPVTGCNKISQGCKNCYAEPMHRRLQHMFPEKYCHTFLSGPVCHKNEIGAPFKWKKGRKVFVNSMSDLFHEKVPYEFIDAIFAVMILTPRHTYQVLTKRSKIMLDYFSRDNAEITQGWVNALDAYGIVDSNDPDLYRIIISQLSSNLIINPIPNIWLGVSVEDYRAAEERIPDLMRIPAKVRFLSCEPLLGPLNLKKINCGKGTIVNALTGFYQGDAGNVLVSLPYRQIHWVIVGGESGHKARPTQYRWVKAIVDDCLSAKVPVFFKQWGEYLPDNKDMSSGGLLLKVGKNAAGRMLDGVEYSQFPE